LGFNHRLIHFLGFKEMAHFLNLAPMHILNLPQFIGQGIPLLGALAHLVFQSFGPVPQLLGLGPQLLHFCLSAGELLLVVGDLHFKRIDGLQDAVGAFLPFDQAPQAEERVDEV
jgi:hypothetical protein